LGNIEFERSEHSAACGRYEQALTLYQQIGDLLGEANCFQSLGDIALKGTDRSTAQTQYDKAISLYRRIGSVLGEANCIQKLGDMALDNSDQAIARVRYEEALALYISIPELYSVGWTHVRLANIANTTILRQRHLTASREAWQLIKRGDLVQRIDAMLPNSD
jgi:tetratricopeptide (TPR) repeat protein